MRVMDIEAKKVKGVMGNICQKLTQGIDRCMQAMLEQLGKEWV